MSAGIFYIGQSLRLKTKKQSDVIACKEFNPLNEEPPHYWYYAFSRDMNHFYREDYLQELIVGAQLPIFETVEV